MTAVAFVVGCVLALVAYEIVAALSHRFYRFRWLTISEMVWRWSDGLDARKRWIWFLVFAGGFIVLGGHFFFSWLRG